MPQFELENVGPGKFSGLVRGRTAEEAAQCGAKLSDGAALRVSSESDVLGWQEVVLNGVTSGRVRLHQRMRFRRD